MKGATRNTELTGLGMPALPANDLNSPDISELVLVTVQRLLEAFPERISVAKLFEGKPGSNGLVPVWSWMLQQKLVAGPVENGCLTLAGYQSACEAIKTHPELTRPLVDPGVPVSHRNANRLVLAVLRVHFTAYLDRTCDSV